MNTYINFNGSIIRSDKKIIGADNRGLRYGDGLFETIKVINNKIVLKKYHFERLFVGLKLLQFELPVFFTEENLATQIVELCKKNNHQNARIRLIIFRGNGGLFDPENHFPNYVIQSWPLLSDNKQLNENGLDIAVFNDGKKSCDIFSNIKSNNFLLYAMAALHAKKNQLNDCLILNIHNRICESTIGNIFCIRDKIVSTPALSEGCVAGVMRKFLLNNLNENGFIINETQLTIEDVKNADEIFLSNAMYGIRWVKRFDNNEYSNSITTEVYNKLIKNLS